jgi:hypothetical protein
LKQLLCISATRLAFCRPCGAAECSHGLRFTRRKAGETQPVEEGFTSQCRPGGTEGFGPLRPCRGEMTTTAFHGWSDAASGVAPPVATILRPAGANERLNAKLHPTRPMPIKRLQSRWPCGCWQSLAYIVRGCPLFESPDGRELIQISAKRCHRWPFGNQWPRLTVLVRYSDQRGGGDLNLILDVLTACVILVELATRNDARQPIRWLWNEKVVGKTRIPSRCHAGLLGHGRDSASVRVLGSSWM